MSAGAARIIEVCFVAPKYTQDAVGDDAHSEHTLASAGGEGARDETAAQGPARAFRHLPPFVSSFFVCLLFSLWFLRSGYSR